MVYMKAHQRSFKRATLLNRGHLINNSLILKAQKPTTYSAPSPQGGKMKTKTKETGMRRALENANMDWKNAAEKRLVFLLTHKRFFTSDDVLVYLTDRGITTHNNSALGGLFHRYSNQGFITEAGFTISTRPSRHKAAIRLWKSNLYKEGRA